MSSHAGKASPAAKLRHGAEKQLNARTAATVLPRTGADTKKLFHELQVHQLELEMQNEELRRSQEELKTARDKYSLLYDFAPVGYFTLARDGSILEANLTGANLLGLECSRLVKRRFRLFVDGQDHPVLAAFLEKVFSSVETQACELILSKEAGRSLVVRVEAVAVESGEECLVAIINISMLVDELRQSRHKEQARRAELESLMEAVPAMVLIAHDPAGRNVTGNQMAYEMTHLPVGANMSKITPATESSLSFETFENGRFIPAVELPIHKAIRTNHPVRDEEVELRFEDGSSRWIFGSAVPLREETGAVRGAIGAFVDVTDRKRAEQELKRAHNELDLRVGERTAELARTIAMLQVEYAERIKSVQELLEKDRMLLQQSRLAAMGEMINNIAHQWRQPLNMLGLNIQRISLFYNMGKFSKEFLDTSSREAMKLIQHMSQTIDVFRDFFKPDKAKTDFNVNQAIRQTISLVENSFDYNQIKIITQIDGEAWINGYPNEFSQALLNILQNSRDVHLERKTSGALVTVVSSIINGNIVITITDNAGGISEEIIDKIFDPYVSTKGLQGTGIGLYMSKIIIETNMGGRITVRNTDQGTEFRIEAAASTCCPVAVKRKISPCH